MTTGLFPHYNFSSVYWIFTKLDHMIPLWKGKNPIYFGVIRSKVKVTITINRIFDNRIVLYRREYFVMHPFLVDIHITPTVNKIFSRYTQTKRGKIQIYIYIFTGNSLRLCIFLQATDYNFDYGTECLHLASKYTGVKVKLIEGSSNLWKVCISNIFM